MPFGSFSWGSCQYDTAADFYHEIKSTKKGIGQKLKSKGIDFEFDVIRSWEQIKEIAENHFRKTYWESEDWADYWEDEKQRQKVIKDFNKIKDVDGLFEYCKHHAWDLWSAAPTIANWVFKDLKIKGVKKAGGIGPIMNVMAQDGNYKVAVYCALLNAFKGVDESAFKEFDT